MSNVARVAGQAANTLVKPLNVEDVFSTYLYEGNGSTQTITNGIDLDGEGGMTWIKVRSRSDNHVVYDTERPSKALFPDGTSGQTDHSSLFGSFNSDGFSLIGNYIGNTPGEDYASWTFRKAPKFFDVVTYTGDGVAGRTVSHNLGSVPGCIIVKVTSAGGNWVVYHRGTDATAPEDYGTKLSSTAAREDNVVFWNDTAPTSTEFSLGTGSLVNQSGATYVAYLFAHNDGDGEFGPDGDADIIKCGSFTTPASAADTFIDLGFEPQWILVKNAGITGSWRIIDVMRGMPTGGGTTALYADQTYSEGTIGSSTNFFNANPTGFTLTSSGHPSFGNNQEVIYIAIRRGPMAVPESATDVFAVETYGGNPPMPPTFRSGFPVDLSLIRTNKTTSQDWNVIDRLRGDRKSLKTNATSAEVSANNSDWYLDSSVGQGTATTGTSTNYLSWMWRRAPNYFDVVAYTGTGANRTITHNLGVAPEMMWVKSRSSGYSWIVQGTAIEAGKRLELNDTLSLTTTNGGASNFTSTSFDLGNWNNVNASGSDYIAYLFASLDGVSKVGSYTGSSGSVNVDCGFTSGARFVLIKRTDSTGSWYVWDSERGIVSGNDPYLILNSTTSEITGNDFIDPLSSGFTVNTGSAAINTSGGTYIFYAIA